MVTAVISIASDVGAGKGCGFMRAMSSWAVVQSVLGKRSSAWPPLERSRVADEEGKLFSRLWLATGAANLGDGIARLALPLLVLGQGGSATSVAAVALAGRAPWLIGSLPAGLIVDRLDRRRLAIGANLSRVVLLGAVALFASAGSVTVPLVLAVTFLIGLAEVLADSATQAMIPTVVPQGDLTVANQRLIGTETVANEFSGPALGGVVSVIGGAVAFGSSAGLFLIAAGVLLSMRGRFVANPTHSRSVANANLPRRAEGRWVGDVFEGWRFIRATPVLRGLVLSVLGMSLAWSAHQAVLVVYLVAPGPDGLSPGTFGFVLGGIGIGGLLGTLLVGRIVRLIGETWTIALDLVGCVGMVAVPLLTANPWWVAAATVGAGFGSGMWSVLVSAMRQRLTPPDLIGRVSSTYRLFSMGSMTLGAGGAVAIVAMGDVRIVFGVFTVVALLACVPYLVWVRPAMRNMSPSSSD